MLQETLIADYRVIDVWARRGMMCGRDSKEREQRNGERALFVFIFCVLGTTRHSRRLFPMDIFRGHRRRLCSLPGDPFTY